MIKWKRSEVKMKKKIVILLLASFLTLFGFCFEDMENLLNSLNEKNEVRTYNLGEIPPYTNEPYVVINNNEPNFTEEQLTKKSFEQYSDLDNLGRCNQALAKIDYTMMPTEPRGKIGMIKPSGWHTVKYDFVDGKYLYNRCHLIAYQLTGENANEKNLITCTRYANTEGMLPFENKVAEYIEKTKNHVLYRVTPIFENDNLLANGIQMEALSIEDNGQGIKFNVYVYNVQKGVSIDYKTGESKLAS